MTHRYELWQEDGPVSMNPLDYWYLSDSWRFDDCILVRRDHPYRLVNGGVIRATRLLKSAPTLRDLRRVT